MYFQTVLQVTDAYTLCSSIYIAVYLTYVLTGTCMPPRGKPTESKATTMTKIRVTTTCYVSLYIIN